jgi:hypothetical protein
MGIYLIKVSLIWGIFLLLFLLLYKRNIHFRLNRILLLSGLLLGIILPLFSLNVLPANYPAAAIRNINYALQRVGTPAGPVASEGEGTGIMTAILIFVYLLGTAVFLLLNIKEMLSIIRMAAYGTGRLKQGYLFFSTDKVHAPFSFMGWIFISRPDQYEVQELDYIIRHEAAHNRSRHWLDVLILQSILLVFWFHPFLWVYRYFLKQQHEYEADAIASEGHAYEYGHFLIRQVLLKGTPAIAHSFHFSPIKNRIAMLTNNRKANKWKYLAVVPVLLCCGILIAKSASDTRKVKTGNVTVFKGNKFYWMDMPVDSILVEDAVTHERVWTIAKRDPSIVKVNKDSTDRDNLDNFTNNGLQIAGYCIAEFGKQAKALPDSLEGLKISNLVIGADGRILYYDADWVWGGSQKEVTDPYFTTLIDDIMERSPAWSSAQKGKSNRPAYVEMGFVIPLKPGKQ